VRFRKRWILWLAVVAVIAGLTPMVLRAGPALRERQLSRMSREQLAAQAAKSPDDPLVCFHYARTLLGSGSANEAAGLFERVTRLRPEMTRAHLGLARCYTELHQIGEAEAAYLRAIEHSPTQPEPRVQLAALYSQNGRAAEAIRTLEEAARAQPGDARLWYLLAHRYGDLQERERALAALEQAVSLKGDQPDYLRDLGRAQWHFNRLDAAEQSLSHALRLRPQDGLTQLWLGEVYARMPDSQQHRHRAEEAFREAVRLLPANAEGFLELGKLMQRAELPDQAEKLFREAIRLNPNHDEALRLLGQQLTRKGDPEGARFVARAERIAAVRRELQTLETAVTKKPDDGAARLRLARLYRRHSDPTRAMVTYADYLDLTPKDQAVRREVEAYRSQLQKAAKAATP
jgi:cytochrome c-type biogenesis protein CcmH/NrfG